MGGSTHSFGAGGYDVYIVKADSQGNFLWSRTYGGINDDFGSSLQQTNDGGYIIAGRTLSFGAGSYDLYIVKTDPFGNMRWSKTYGGVGSDWGYSIIQTNDGGYIVTGYTYSLGPQNVYLVKTDSMGDTLWTKIYGGSEGDQGFCVQQTIDGGYIISGLTYSFDVGNGDVYLIKTDSFGDTLWTRSYGGTAMDIGWSVTVTSDTGYVVAGRTYSYGQGFVDAYLLKTDQYGDTLWTKTYGGDEWNVTYSVEVTSDNGFLLVGEIDTTGWGKTDVYVIKTDSQGNTLWTKSIGDSLADYGESGQETADNGYIIGGFSNSFGIGRDYNIYLIKLSHIGVIEEESTSPSEKQNVDFTFIRGSLKLPENIKYRIFDIAGRLQEKNSLNPGIYFIEIEGKSILKVLKVR